MLLVGVSIVTTFQEGNFVLLIESLKNVPCPLVRHFHHEEFKGKKKIKHVYRDQSMAVVLAYLCVDVLFLLGAFSPRVILNLVGSVLSGVSQNQEGGAL